MPIFLYVFMTFEPNIIHQIQVMFVLNIHTCVYRKCCQLLILLLYREVATFFLHLFISNNKLIKLKNTWYIYKCLIVTQPEEREKHFLSHPEERTLLRFYELQLRDFCRRFNPPMPRATVATALHYFKRFYLRNSVMDYHPKEILVTCVYLACKVIVLFDISFFVVICNFNLFI